LFETGRPGPNREAPRLNRDERYLRTSDVNDWTAPGGSGAGRGAPGPAMREGGYRRARAAFESLGALAIALVGPSCGGKGEPQPAGAEKGRVGRAGTRRLLIGLDAADLRLCFPAARRPDVFRLRG
jgi:hypothetical protein